MSETAVRVGKPVRERISKEEWDARVNLDACCRLMADCAMIQAVLQLPSPEVIGYFNHLMLRGVHRRPGVLAWPAPLRKLDRIDPTYRD